MNSDPNQDYQVILFYKFIHIKDPELLRDQQRALCEELGLMGRLLIASEGINGTFEGSTKAVKDYVEYMNNHELFSDMSFKYSNSNGQAFHKLKVKVRPEIVTLKSDRVLNPQTETAPEITAEELEKWYEQGEDFVVLDLRNSYEIESGYFEKTYDPGLENFRDFNDKLDEIASDPRVKGKKIVPVCTGGIRCEKATCLMDDERFPEVYQLKDGIHDYMAKFPNSHFKGSLFVFDNRNVTDIGAGGKREIVGICSYCENKTENYVNDDSVRPSKKLLCCHECYELRADTLRAFVA